MNRKIVKFYHLSISCLYQLIQAYHQYVVGSRPALLITKKGALNKVYQFLAHGRWFSLGTPASSTTKTGHHDILIK